MIAAVLLAVLVPLVKKWFRQDGSGTTVKGSDNIENIHAWGSVSPFRKHPSAGASMWRNKR